MSGIAIIGMACRLPGGLDTISLLWDALCHKVNTASEVPSDRWDSDHYYSAAAEAVGKAYVRRGNFLRQDVRSMDAAFFDLPPSVAENMDPQQRLMLEVVWEAFENAGLDLPAHSGRSVGVYTGGFMLDHMITQMSVANRSVINQNTAAGMMMTMLSNRVSHAFDFHGPSLSIDTACSSSLTAFNYGAQDIWRGAADIAVVGGVNIMTRPEYPVGMCKGQFLARDGECKSFDERGDGYGRGEGAGVVLLKDLEKALADGDPILATVLATGVNSDGRTPGISMPSGDAQRTLAEEVCRDNGIDPASIHYVECHGTGTAIGDPTEAGSLGAVYGAGREDDDRVVIGTIKSNIGHTEAVAGVAGVIKAVLTLQHRTASPLANLKDPNPAIPFDDLGLQLPIEAVPLGKDGETLRAAVNSFGYGGTNAHAILEEYPREERAAGHALPPRAAAEAVAPRMLPISARSNRALSALAGEYAELLRSESADLEDILYSSSARRAHLSHRAVAIGKTREELQAALAAYATDAPDANLVTGDMAFGAREEPVFVYTGMGPQWWGMGQELYRENRLFKDALDEADAIFEGVSGFSILEEMLRNEADSQITKTEFAQPGNFMVQYGLTKLLAAAGVKPGAIVGHSVGEVTSAWSAGILTLEDALTVSFHRSRMQAKTAGTGSMLAVGMSQDKLETLIAEFRGQIDLAAANGPGTMTVAGDTISIRRLADALSAHQVFNKLLQVEVPYHSYLMDPILDELREELRDLVPKSASRRLYSTVTGEPIETGYDGEYWVQNVRRPVAFSKAISGLLNEGFGNFIEIGPHPVLRSALRDCAKAAGKEIRLVETLRRGKPEVERFNQSVAQTYANGAKLDWSRHNPAGHFVALPNYPWERREFWLETDRAQSDRIAPTTNPMLGVPAVSVGRVWRNDVDHSSLDYLRDHVVSGAPVMPAAGYLELLLEAGAELHPEGQIELRDVEIAAPLVISLDRRLEIVTTVDPETRRATIRSGVSGGISAGQLHMSAEIAPVQSAQAAPSDLRELKLRFGENEDRDAFYRDLASSGLEYGPAFQAVNELRLSRDTAEALARIEIDESGLDGYRMHPSVLDGCFQILMAVLQGEDTMYLPTGFRSIRVFAEKSPSRIWCHGALKSRTAKHIDCDLTLYGDDGEVVALVQGMRATAGAGRARQRTDKWGDPVKLQVLESNWKPAPMLAEPRRLGAWLIVNDARLGFADKLAERIRGYGAIVHRNVSIGDNWSEDEQGITIRSGNEEDADRLLAGSGSIEGIVFASGLDATGDSADPTGEDAVATLIALSKALSKYDPDTRPRMYVLTQNAFICDGADRIVEPAQRAINGFVRVAHNELEGSNMSSVDLPARLDDRIVEAAALEVLCDAAEDEVALRGRRRLMSVGVLSESLSRPMTDALILSDETPVRVRPSPGMASEGMVDLVKLDLPPISQSDIRLRLSSMSLPSSLLADTSSETLDQPFVAMVAEVSEIGSAVTDLSVGQRVYGFIPADFASHVQGPRSAFQISPMPDGVSDEVALDALEDRVGAEVAVASSALEPGDTALALASDPMASSVAAALEARGILISRVGAIDSSKGDAVEDVDTVPDLGAEIAAAVARTPQSAGFDAIIAPVADWLRDYTSSALRLGGVLIDTSQDAQTIAVPKGVSNIIRTDLTTLAGRGRRLQSALKSLSIQLTDAAPRGSAVGIGLSGIVSRKLELPPVNFRVDVSFDLVGREFPVIVNRALNFSPEASYLVTGGLGGFGQRTALWLAAHGARELILASRSGANSAEKSAFIDALTAQGVKVHTPQADLSDRDAVERLVGWIDQSCNPLKGIFHAAAVIEDEDLSQIDLDSYRRVMRAKATSADALDRATMHIELDWFVMYSSVANLVGNRRQAPYSAANGFIDGLVAARRARGQSGLTVNWGAIGGVGVLADDEATEQFLRYIGIRPIPADEALGFLGAAMQRDIGQVGVLFMTSWADWARYETVGAQSPRLADLIAEDLAAGESGGSEVRAQMIEQLSELSPADQFDVLSGLVREVIARELRVEPDTLSIDRPINELGVDSLMAAEIQMALESDIAVSISVMDMLGNASIRSVCDRSLADFGLIEAVAAE